MTNKVFCGGLAWATDEIGLKMAMTDFGPVRETKVVMDRETGKSKGFGFVTFEDPEAAQAAVQAGTINLDGRTVNIQEANDNGGGRKNGPRSRR